MAVRADELIRKPFQPQDLIARVKNLLNPKSAGNSASDASGGDSAEVSRASSQALSGMFSAGPAAAAPASPVAPPSFAAPRAASAPVAAVAPKPIVPVPAAPRPAPASSAPVAAPASADVQKLRNEIRRLEFFVKKLQAELEAEHKYCEALEAHFKTLQESE
jgi:hypothetical protein